MGSLNSRLTLLIFPLAIILFPVTTKAQLCNGSLGDPTVNITFDGSAASLAAYVPAGMYTYTASSCPDDGYYTFTKRTSDCFNNTWHTVSSDHTGAGNFLLVNAAYAAGDFF